MILCGKTSELEFDFLRLWRFCLAPRLSMLYNVLLKKSRTGKWRMCKQEGESLKELKYSMGLTSFSRLILGTRELKRE